MMDHSVDGRPDVGSEVSEKPVRRRFDVAYKLRILAEADRCTEFGQLGQLLRREGLYSSHLSVWRRQREQGVLAGLAPKRRGRKAKPNNPLARENAQLAAASRDLATLLDERHDSARTDSVEITLCPLARAIRSRM